MPTRTGITLLTSPLHFSAIGQRIPFESIKGKLIGAALVFMSVLQFLAPKYAFAQMSNQMQLPSNLAEANGPLSIFGASLAKQGITFNSMAYDVGENNVSTGNRIGRTSNNVSVFLGTDFHLEKLVGINGATVHVGVGWFFGRMRNGPRINAIQDTSSVLAGLPIINRSRSWYLTSLSYEQKILNDRLDIEFGRINAKRAFDRPYSGNTYSSDDPVFVMDGQTSPAPYAHWGARASYQLSSRLQFGAGAYEVFPAEIRTFGTDWRTNQATGILLAENAVYQTQFADTTLPGRYELVPFFNTAPISDPLLAKVHHNGPYGIAARLQQTIWRARGPEQNLMSPQHIDILGSFSYTPNPYVVAASNEEVGLGLYGFTPDTPDDSVQVKVDHLNLGDRVITSEQEARVAAGGPNVATSRNEFRFEVNAYIDLGYSFAFEPTVEYILNPDSDGLPNSPVMPRSGFALAGMLVFRPTELLGLSSG